MNKEIEKIRKKIDKVDKKLEKLLEERADNVLKIRKIKDNNKIKIIDKNREEEILSKFDSHYKKEIFKKIIEESRNLQS